jgi:hypothetical protein
VPELCERRDENARLKRLASGRMMGRHVQPVVTGTESEPTSARTMASKEV